MAEPSNNPHSSLDEDDEYWDPLEVAASAGAWILQKKPVSLGKESDFKDLLRETQSHKIDESVWYNYVYNTYVKWNLFYKYLLKLLINLLHLKKRNKKQLLSNFWIWGQLLSDFLSLGATF